VVNLFTTWEIKLPLITSQNFQSIGASLHLGKVLNRVHRFWCEPLTRRGQCHDCRTCLETFKDIIKRAEAPDTKEPYALLVWLLRDRAAELAEEAERPTAVATTNWLGERAETNPFERLGKL
jgi:hypothetical protein